MYRRVVSLFLLPCVLLAQSASLGHAHGSSQPSDHILRPHVHVKLEKQAHSHSHGTESHHHHHDVAMPTESAIPDEQPEPTHDSDAVYVSAIDLVVLQSSLVLVKDQSSVFLSVVELAILASSFDCNQVAAAICSHPSPFNVQHCARYIQLLTLII